MNQNNKIKMLEETKNEIIRFTNELDEKLARKEINSIEYHMVLNEKLGGKTKEELINHIEQKIAAEKNKAQKNKKKIITFSAAAIVILLIAIIGIFYTTPGILTGYTTATKEVQEIIDYNRVFDHNTETQLTLNNLTGLKINGVLEGTEAKVKLRIDGTEYLIAQITNPTQPSSLITGMVVGEETTSYALTTDKTEYAINETVTIILTPDSENKSIYITRGEETQKLETNTYTPTIAGDYQVIVLIVLSDNILRLDTNFTVTETAGEIIPETPPITNETANETTNATNNQTNETTPTEPTPGTPANTFTFENLCTETCNLPENTNPILIVELDENTTLTISTITTTQNKENLAPEQTKTIPDINLAISESKTIDLNNYFKDPENDLTQYDINEIPEINANIKQNELTITSTTPGVYVAYIYATDGNKLTTSNTFQITITETATPTTNETNQTNETINETGLPINNETSNITLNQTSTPTEITTDPCSNEDINLRPAYCFVGIENKVFQELEAPLMNREGDVLGRFNKFGNLIIKGLLVQDALGEPIPDDFLIGYKQVQAFEENTFYTAWIDKDTGNLYIRGKVYEEQEIVVPPLEDTYIIQNKFGIVLGYFDEITGDLYLKGNMVQLGKI